MVDGVRIWLEAMNLCHRAVVPEMHDDKHEYEHCVHVYFAQEAKSFDSKARHTSTYH